MRTGQVVVWALALTSLTVASGAWLYQRSLMRRPARAAPAPAPSLRVEQPSERQTVPGGVPAAAPLEEAKVAAAPGTVPSVWAEKNKEAIRALEQEEYDRAIEL